MLIIYPLVSILLLVAGGAGLFVTLGGSEFASTIWLQGVITFGVFLLIGLIILITLLTVLVEHE